MLYIFFLKGGADHDRQALDSLIREPHPDRLASKRFQRDAMELGRMSGIEVHFKETDQPRLRDNWTGTPGVGDI